MKRRKLIKVAFYSTSGIALSTLLPGCKGDVLEIDMDNYSPKLFAEIDFEFLQSYANILLPSSNTPGAKSTGLVQIVDRIEAVILDDDKKEILSKNAAMLRTHFSKKAGDTAFSELEDEQQVALVSEIDTDLMNGDTDASNAYKYVKGKLVHYYLNTEEVGTQLLNYLPVPGEYEACISLEEEGGKAWTI